MSSEFSHGWNSLSSHNHVFRVDASFGVADSIYTFSIDGVPFIELPREAVHDSSTKKSTGNGHTKAATQVSPNRIAEDRRGGFQSPQDNWDSFESSDPFAETKPSASSGFASSDPFADEAEPARAHHPSSIKITGSNHSNQGSNKHAGSRPTSTTATSKLVAPKATVPAFDGFDDNPFPSARSSGRKASYLEDLASLSTTVPTANDIFSKVDDPFAPKPVIIPTATVPTMGGTSTNGSTDIIDLATKSLVSLDLNKSPAISSGPIGAAANKARKDEYEKNLSLNTLMGVNQAPKPVMMTSDSFNTPQMQPQAPPMRILSPAEAISSMGHRPMPMMPPGATLMPYGGVPAAVPQYGATSYMSPPMGAPIGSPPMNSSRPLSVSSNNGGIAQYGSYGQPSKAPAANPLDSLNWKM
jgi:hypothetical protein